ncbi:MAG: sugar ABC transporter permease [Acidimicrobiales bacterium]|nr:sugar ABC transporter permease [Acidimicrobiales bacterium]RZV46278.1 MAG: sugar ABC transporter permease [Acidimicrobiales bacterium]
MKVQRDLPIIAAILGAVILPIVRATEPGMSLLSYFQWATFGAGVLGALGLVFTSGEEPFWTKVGSTIRVAVVSVIGAVALYYILTTSESFDRVASTMFVVLCAVSIIGGSWVISNVLLDLAQKNWALFSAASAAIAAAVGFSITRGNLVLQSLVVDPDPVLFSAGGGWGGRLEWPIFGALLWGVGVYAMRIVPVQAGRLLIGSALGLITGWLIAANQQPWQLPDINWVTTAIWTVVVAGLLGGIAAFRGRDPIPSVILGAGVGFAIGAWLMSPFLGAVGVGRWASIIPLALLGVRIGWRQTPTPRSLSVFDNRARAFVFLGPAMLFLFSALVVPAVATIILSFRNRDGDEFVGFDNYRTFFADEDSVDLSGWRDLFTSDLYSVGFLLIGAGLIIGLVANSRRNRVGLLEGSSGSIALLAGAVVMFAATVWSILGERITSGQFLSVPAFLVILVLLAILSLGAIALTGKVDAFDSFERTSASVGSVIAGLFLMSYAVLSVVRGTFFNNIWWVITVTTLSVTLGLAIAALAEKAGSTENVAKSFIFMPMAISFVGASVVWRLQYQPRFPATETQTSVMNSTWVELGELSFSGWPRILVLLVLAGLIGLLVKSAVGRARIGETFAGQMVGIVAFAFLFFKLADRSLGGFKEAADGTYGGPDVVRFLQDAPFNNVFMMIILIWIQTGFAMVIFSAAIKAVPQEFIEAANVDGATESQTFFRVIVPQILPTIGVVATTLIVLVTKVFDIVKVSTGGNFGTNVLANDMFEVSFSFFNRGLGSAIAVFILVSVLPVMFMNVRRMQQERVMNR